MTKKFRLKNTFVAQELEARQLLAQGDSCCSGDAVTPNCFEALQTLSAWSYTAADWTSCSACSSGACTANNAAALPAAASTPTTLILNLVAAASPLPQGGATLSLTGSPNTLTSLTINDLLGADITTTVGSSTEVDFTCDTTGTNTTPLNVQNAAGTLIFAAGFGCTSASIAANATAVSNFKFGGAVTLTGEIDANTQTLGAGASFTLGLTGTGADTITLQGFTAAGSVQPTVTLAGGTWALQNSTVLSVADLNVSAAAALNVDYGSQLNIQQTAANNTLTAALTYSGPLSAFTTTDTTVASMTNLGLGNADIGFGVPSGTPTPLSVGTSGIQMPSGAVFTSTLTGTGTGAPTYTVTSTAGTGGVFSVSIATGSPSVVAQTYTAPAPLLNPATLSATAYAVWAAQNNYS